MRTKDKSFKLIWLFFLILPLATFLLVVFPQSKNLNLVLIGGLGVIYLTAANLHHYHDKTLTLEVILEYVLLAILAFVIAQSIIF